MKVLLLGEYGGLHNSLKAGLERLGVKAAVATDGDAWKSFPSDINFVSPFSPTSPAGRVFKNVKPFFLLNQFHEYDLVQLINPLILTPRFGINNMFVDRVIDRAKKIFLVGAGDDAYYYEAIKKFQYSPFPDYKALDNKGATLPFETQSLIDLNHRIVAKASGILPVAYDYWAGYAECPRVHPVIPMPIDVEKYVYMPNIVASKMVFYHGINRGGFKGSKYIIEAFDIMRKTHGDEAEFIVADRIPITEYVKVLARTNVVVDQSLSYSYGMNALISMAMGKVVMSGAEAEILPIYGVPRHPVVNIRPDVGQICDQIRALLQQRVEFQSLGQASRAFVEQVHSHVVVAGRFLATWNAC